MKQKAPQETQIRGLNGDRKALEDKGSKGMSEGAKRGGDPGATSNTKHDNPGRQPMKARTATATDTIPSKYHTKSKG